MDETKIIHKFPSKMITPIFWLQGTSNTMNCDGDF